MSVSIFLTISGVSLIVVILAAFVRKGLPRVITLVTSVIMAISTSMWVEVIKDLNAENLLSKIIIFIVGMFLMCVGLAIYLIPKLPATSADDFMVALIEKDFSIRKAKLSIDITCIVIAFILKVPIGIGTIMLTLAIGSAVDFVYDIIIRKYHLN
ncbi:hypothetical protein CLPUN_23530 [Clostridium puniceum]|uniref:Uncharacterized protein n=1 Tax=Clostridium puniceum TaxID=29367 RepID=A0A1S8THT0_9CLOT|nr:hypothetical protein [Clostridium puniceum]OOM77236.1 hypothetical protein CLPUN_23530 [Clostridium puniceum]